MLVDITWWVEMGLILAELEELVRVTKELMAVLEKPMAELEELTTVLGMLGQQIQHYCMHQGLDHCENEESTEGDIAPGKFTDLNVATQLWYRNHECSTENQKTILNYAQYLPQGLVLTNQRSFPIMAET